MTTDGASGVPKHAWIAADLRRRIRDEEFRIGDLLPGISDLERHYQAALNTIRRAEAILREEGLIRITQGIGAEVIAVPRHDIRELVNDVKTALAKLEAALESTEPSMRPHERGQQA